MRINEKKQFDLFLSRFGEKEKGEILYLLYNVKNKLNLSAKENGKIIGDYKKSIIFLHHNNVSIEEIIKRLSPDNLGDFYFESDNRWYPLDNAAKVYPLSMQHNWMAVFRLSLYVKDYVSPELLQMALNFTIKRFPYFATTVKKGIFWHYLDGKNTRYEVSRENSRPVSTMKLMRANSLPFRVFYFRNRISVEYFHILTDGTGGMIFLKTLVAEYLKLLGKNIVAGKGVLEVNQKPKEEEWANGFLAVEKTESPKGFPSKPARALKGVVSAEKPYKVLHFVMNESDLSAKAKEKNLTVTALLLSYIFVCLKKATSGKKTIQVQVPCNMRKFYNVGTIRNFSMFGNIEMSGEDIIDQNQIANEMKRQLLRATKKDNLTFAVDYSNRLVKSIRFIPLFIKSPLVKIVHFFVGDNSLTATLSNLGKLDFPQGMKEEIIKSDFVLGPTKSNRVMLAVSSCNNNVVLAITLVTKDSTFEDSLYDLLEQEGIGIFVEGSVNYDERSKHNLSKNKQ